MSSPTRAQRPMQRGPIATSPTPPRRKSREDQLHWAYLCDYRDGTTTALSVSCAWFDRLFRPVQPGMPQVAAALSDRILSSSRSQEDKAELAMTLFTYIKATRGYWSWRNQVSKPGQIFHAVLNVYGDGELCMVIADDSEGDFGPVQAKEISGMLFRSDIDERPGFLPGLGRALH